MTRSTRTKRWVAALAALALAAPLAAQATSDGGVPRTDQSRMLYATDSGGNLISFRAGSPSRIRELRPPDRASRRGEARRNRLPAGHG